MRVQTASSNGRPTDGQGQRTHAGRAFGRGVSGVVQDVVELSSLQAQLTAVDIREAGSRAVVPLACLVGALLITVCSLPLVLLGIGEALISHFGWSETTAYLTTAAVAMLIAAGIGWIGWIKLRAAASILERSGRELLENVNTIRETLTRSEVN